MSVVVCAVPELPHLDPLLGGVRQWLAAEHIPHHNLPSVQALLGDPELMAQVQVAVGFGTMPMTATVFDAAPRLHAVVSCVSGTDGFDVPAATARGIVVAHAATADNQRGMAEAAVMLMLNLVHDLDASRDAMRLGLPRPYPMAAQSLWGKTIGLVGWGRISAMTAELLRPWGVRILVHSRRENPGHLPDHVTLTPLDRLMRESDVVCVLAGAQAGAPPIVTRAHLGLLKPSAFFLSLARGSTVDEAALTELLSQKRIAGAALDVFQTEPLAASSALRALDHVILTPHRVGHTFESDQSLIAATTANVQAVWRGQAPPLLCNPGALALWPKRQPRADTA
jgi:phosphoglycerate dehydrogenase-like enzyme